MSEAAAPFWWCRLAGDGDDLVEWSFRRAAQAATGPTDADRRLREQIELIFTLVGPVAREGYVRVLAKFYKVSIPTVRAVAKEVLSPPPTARSDTSQAGSTQGGAGIPSAGTPAAEPDNAALLESLDEFNRRHFKTWFGGASYVGRETTDDDGRTTVQFVTTGDLTRYYSHVRVPVWSTKKESWEVKELAKHWLDWPLVRTYERVAFRPDGQVGPDTYNLWRGFDVEPAAGDCSLYWAHVRDVVCSGDPELYTYVRRWLAHAVQRVDELPEVALVLRGLQGTGKGWFLRPMLQIFGSHALTVHSMDHVSGRFNAHLKDVVLLFADEAFWGGDRSREGLIKGLVTERKRLVEPKNKDAQQVDSYTRLVLATNTDWPVAMDHDDRRILVLDVSDVCKEDAAYFGALARQMAEGGTAALMADLLAEDLTGWHPRDKPQRGNGFDIKLRSSSATSQWWHECLMNRANQRYENTTDDPVADADWNDCPYVADLHGHYHTWCERLGRRFIEPAALWARELRRLVPHLTGYRPTGGSRRRCYQLGTVDECRQAFQAHYRCGPEVWAEPEPDYQEAF